MDRWVGQRWGCSGALACGGPGFLTRIASLGLAPGSQEFPGLVFRKQGTYWVVSKKNLFSLHFVVFNLLEFDQISLF